MNEWMEIKVKNRTDRIAHKLLNDIFISNLYAWLDAWCFVNNIHLFIHSFIHYISIIMNEWIYLAHFFSLFFHSIDSIQFSFFFVHSIQWHLKLLKAVEKKTIFFTFNSSSSCVCVWNVPFGNLEQIFKKFIERVNIIWMPFCC